MKKRHCILDDEKTKNWFVRSYPDMRNVVIATYLGISVNYVRGLARKLGIRKSKDFVRCSAALRVERLRQFHATKKGDKDYYSYNRRERQANGKFKKSS